MENLKKELVDLEVKIEKYPLAVSPRLIDEFLIMGYTEEIKKEKAINPIKSSKNYDELDFLKEHTINHLPTVISIITSNADFTLADTQSLINYAFPIPPKLYYCNSEIEIKEPEISKIVFNNIHNDIVHIGYAYSFYEKEIIKLNEKKSIIFFFPKAFVILSQYNYFYAFHKICEYLHKQYLSDKIEIPLEIQIYNIVNYIPCPLDNNLELNIFPNTDLSSIVKCNNLDEYKKLSTSKDFINLEQLGGYKHTEINFCRILDILTPEIIVQIYLELLCGKNVAFFSENKENLHYLLLVFSHLLFPLAGKETVHSLNPNKYFNASEILHNFIFGFLSSYMIIDFFDPKPKDSKKTNFLIFEDEQSALPERKKFDKGKVKCDFIVDVEEGIFNLYEEQENPNVNKNEGKEEEDECDDDEGINLINDDKLKQEIARKKFLYGYFNSLFNDNLEGNLSITLDILIKELYTKLKSLSILVKNEKLNSFFVENKEIKNISEQIQEAFLRFNLLICNNYFIIFSRYKGELIKDVDFNEKTKEDLGISEAEFYFYDNFEKTSNRDMLINLVGGYDENEPKLQKVSKRGFDNLLATCKEDANNILLLKEHYIELLDCVFINENQKNSKYISFFEFFKYFNQNLKSFIYNNINDDYLNKKIIKKDNHDIYYYKYKKISIDRELLIKYCYYMDELSDDVKKNLFPITENTNSIEKIIYTKDYYKCYDAFMISHKIYNLKNIIQFCILNIVILSTSELKLINFEEQIYSLIRSMNIGIRKYVELILNVSYRVFIKKNITNINIVKKYFDFYKIGMEEKKIFPNNELIVLEEHINKFIGLLKEENNISENEIISKIKNMDENDLFKLDAENIEKNDMNNEIYEHIENGDKEIKNISLKSDLLGEEEISNDCIYYPYSLYLKLNDLIEKYYISLDIKSLGKNEYHKLIINVIYYVRLIKDKFPEGIIKFLFYCLCKNSEEK